jgi:4-diphosphocytidyl-2C-methyl-D-erythritol kinase
VPLFLAGAPAVRIRGRGERVEAIDLPEFRAVVCMPALHCSTAAVYAAYDALLAERGSRRGRGARGTTQAAPGGAWDARGRGLRLSGPPSRWAEALFNDLRPAAEKVCPALADVAWRLAAAAGLPVHLTGSGSAMFILADDDAEASGILAGLPADLRAMSVAVRSNPW